MKIGFSFGRCIRDIVRGDIEYKDVAWIISGTALRDEEAVKWCIEEYMYRRDYLLGLDHDRCVEVGVNLFNEGKVFQPRLQGIRAFHIPEDAVWADLFPTNLTDNPAAKSAWDNYRFMLHMTEQVPEDAKENWTK